MTMAKLDDGIVLAAFRRGHHHLLQGASPTNPTDMADEHGLARKIGHDLARQTRAAHASLSYGNSSHTDSVSKK